MPEMKKNSAYFGCLLVSVCPFSSLIFLLCFASNHWIEYDSEKRHRGLWEECTKTNQTNSDNSIALHCSRMVLADGPAFLDWTRTLMCFTLVFYAAAWYGFCTAQNGAEPRLTLKMQFKLRMQEFAFLIGGLLGVTGNIIYGVHYYDYHANELGFEDLRFGHIFYLCCVVTGLIAVSSFILICTNDTGLIKTIKQILPCFKPGRVPQNPKPKAKKAWQRSKAKTAPNNETKDEKKTDNQTKDEKKTEVAIKTRKLARFFPPVTLIQAIRRLKHGMSHNDKEPLVENENSKRNKKKQKAVVTKEKQKGLDVFTINVDNCSDEKGHDIRESPNKQMNKQCNINTAADIEAPDQTSVSCDDKVDNNIDDTRHPTIQGKMVEEKLRDDASFNSVKYQKFGNSSKTLKLEMEGTDVAEDSLSIYTIPSEPGPMSPNISIDYEEVIGHPVQGRVDDIKPLIAPQSTTIQQ